ncbi:MAG: non-ribosomal peptide synthetase [Acidimicrobiales bacterium]|nr:non-ribosomal peptide synthetase [Acidimicrobiales bacterium]
MPTRPGGPVDGVAGRIRRWAIERGAGPAVDAPGRSGLTFAGLAETLAGLHETLRQKGIGREHLVAHAIPDGPEAATAFLGAAGAAISAPVSPSLPPVELERVLRRLGARALVALPDARPSLGETASRLGIPLLVALAEPGGPAGAIRIDGPAAGPAVADSGAALSDVALVLSTSGTTGAPKAVPLTHGNLLAAADAWGRALALGRSDRSLVVMPLFHVHGLVVALLAGLAAGGSVVCTDGFAAAATLHWIGSEHPTWVTAVPTMWAALAERGRAHPDEVLDHRLRFVRSASAPLAPSVLADVEALLGVPLLEGYAMTETASCIATNPLPPAVRKPGTVGLPLVADLAVVAAGRPVPAGETGEVWVRGPTVTPGYRGDPDASAEAFVDGWLRTGDLGWLDADGYLRIVGRVKEMINRGGETISPREVDDVLLEHPDVARAVTFAVPDRRLGEQVAALVVPAPGTAPSERQLRAFAAERLAPWKVPRRIVCGASVPVGPTGKPQRDRLADALGLADLDDDGEGVGPSTPPRTEVERFLAELWCEVLRLDEVAVHDRFLDVGGDSLRATRLLSRVRDEIGLEISLLDFFDAPTIARQAELLDDLLLADDDG